MVGRLSVVGVVVVGMLAVGPAPAVLAQVASDMGVPAGLDGVYTPPPCAGTYFLDVTCSTPFDAWIEQFVRDGITAGCGGGNYCPGSTVTRDQMAVFIEKAMRGTANWPPHAQLVWAVKASDGSPDPTASGAALLNAIAAIPAAGADTPSSSNPWLVKVGPGIYDLGSGSLVLPAHTAIEGAGEDITTIVAAGSASQAGGTLVLADHSQARFMTVKNVGGGAYADGIAVAASATGVRLYRLTIDASQPSNATANRTFGITAGTDTQVFASDVTVSAHGGYDNYGVYVGATSQPVTLDSVTVTATGSNAAGVALGVHCAGAPALITNSTIRASSGSYAQAVTVGAGVEWTMQSSRVYATSTTYPTAIYSNATMTHLQDVFVVSEGQGIVLGSCGVGACNAEISHCRVATNSWALANGANFFTLVAASRLNGGTLNSGGTLTCMGNYTASAFYASTCP